jgi:hypothetical protein
MRDTVFLTRHRDDDKSFVIEKMTSTPREKPMPEERDLATVARSIASIARAAQKPDPGSPVTGDDLLDALTLLRWAQAELGALEPVLIAAARAAGVSWQALAPALGVASRQAAERRYLRSASASTGQPGATRDDRVQAERDRRAAHRAVARWANDNTADLRRLAGQITALTDLDEAATDDLAQLHRALGDTDASALPALLAAAHQHLPGHPDLAAQIDTVTSRTDEIRRRPPRRSDS